MPDYTVKQYGHDSGGRPLYMTAYMNDWWERVVSTLGFRPTIVQGAFMLRAGGGADASAGYHDQGGCLDLRTWDLSGAQVESVIKVTRQSGAASWVRDQRHGMDPHIHFVLGSDEPLASGAAYQWQQYLNGRDGLAGNGADYHWRPYPLVTVPEEDDMFETEDRKMLKEIHAISKASRERERQLREKVNEVVRKLDNLAEETSDDATKEQAKKIREDIASLAVSE